MLQSGPRGSPAPPPPRPSGISALPHIIAHAIAPVEHVAQVVQHSAPAQHYIATHSPPPPLSQARLTHVAGRTAPVASFEAHSLPQPAYLQAVAQVFRSQSPQIQARVISGITARNAFDTPEYHAIRIQWDHLPTPTRDTISSLIPKDLPSFISPKNGPDLFGDVGKGISAAVSDVGKGVGRLFGADGGGSAGYAKGLTGGALSGIGTVLPFGGQKGAVTLLKNTGKDAWNLGPATVEGLYGLGKNVVTGHEGSALKMLADPFIQFAEHPGQTFYQHPLNTALLVAGGKAGIGRGAGALMRSGTFGERAAEVASTRRAPLHLGTVADSPAPILEHRDYSPDVFNKAVQVAREKVIRSRGRNPNVSAPAPGWLHPSIAYALNTGSEAKLRRISDEMTAVRQMAGRQERARVLNELHKDAPSKTARNVVSHVLQGVIRKPETAVADVMKEIDRLKAAQTGRRSVGEIQNRAQVRDLSRAVRTPGALDEAFRSAARIRPLINAQDAYLTAHGLLDPEQAVRSKLIPYAMAHMGAKYDHVEQAFKHATGADLPTHEILDHLQANGVPDPAFVGHFPGKVAPHRFYSAYKLARGTLAQGKRTGDAFKSGAYDHSFEGLAGQVASRAEAATKASLHDRVVDRLGILKPQDLRRPGENGMFTPEEARRAARSMLVDDNGNRIPGALELTPITAGPVKLLDEVRNLQHPQELHNLSGVELKALGHAINDAASRTDKTRNVVLAPTAATTRFAEQFAKTDSTMRSIGRVTQQFRRTVLPYSTHWMTQIASEAGLRALLGGALDPRYLSAGRRLVKEMEGSEKGRAAAMETVNATFFNKNDPLAVRNPNPGMISGAAHAFPPTRVIIAAHNHYADSVGHAMYSLEHNARLMGLGKLAHKEIQSFGFSWQNAVHMQGRALAQLADRMKNDPALVAKFGREIDNMFGKYNKFTPRQRAMIQSITPFLPWYLNAAKYVLWHLPAHHPVASALLASLRQTVNQDVQDGKQAPLNMYAMQELARISPFGIFTPSSTTPSTGAALTGQGITGAILPQIEGSLYALGGQNVFGEGPLKQPPSGTNYKGDVKPRSGPAAAAAAESLLESFLPIARYVRLAREKGKPAYGTSTVLSPQTKNEPGTALANRIFNPFYSFERSGGKGPAYGAPPGPPSSSKGWNFSGGGSPAPSPSSTKGWNFSGGGSSGGSSGGWNFGGS